MMDPKKNKQKINKNNLNLKTKLKVVLLAYTFLGVNNYSKINLGYFHVFFLCTYLFNQNNKVSSLTLFV